MELTKDKKLTEQQLAQVDVLGTEIAVLKDLVAGEDDPAAREQLENDLHQVIAQMNRVLGVRMEVIE
jgi:hypothetical protein